MRITGLMGAALVAAISGYSASAACVAGEDTEARIAAIEAQIARIRAESSSWLNREQTAAFVREALEDSAGRSSLLQGGAVTGFRDGQGFFLSNEDGTFDANFYGYGMFRSVFNSRDSADRDTFGFENSATKFGVRGHAGSSDLTYSIQFAFDANTGAAVLEDANVAWRLGQGWSWSWGQVKAPFIREQVMGDIVQLAVDRSYINALTSLGRVQGTWLSYENETWRFWAAFSDGNRIPSLAAPHVQSRNTPFNVDGTEWAFTARAETMIAGDNWKQFADFTSWSTDEFGALVGGAIHWQDGEYGTAAEETKVLTWTIDAMIEFGGASLSGWVVGIHTSPNATAAPEFDQFGLVVQGGLHLVPDKFEVFARYEWFDFDGFAGLGDLSIVTLGFNYYFRKHGWKWTTDWIYAFDHVPTTVGATGLLADGAGEEGQWAIRSQMQIAVP